MTLIVSVLVGLATLSAPSAQAAPPSMLPLTVQNNSGRGDAVYLYVTGILNGRAGYLNASGGFTPWTGGAIPPSPAPDASIPGPGNGGSRTLQIPLGLAGGRMYMSFGQKLKFFLVPGGNLVQPAPWAAGDANRDILFDWSEFTYDNGGLWLNSSQVDMFSVPHAVEVTTGTGAVKRTGQLVSGGRNRIFDQHQALGGDWARLVYSAGGQRLRVLNPSKGLDAGVFNANYFNSYVAGAWSTYQSQPLTVVPYENQPGVRFTGRTSGGVLNFTNTSGGHVASFQQPSSRDIFNCDGRLAAPNNDIGAISRSLCAALNRSTLGFLHTQPTTNPSQFYTRATTNHYSKIIHQNMVDGKAYGFAFDDVGHFESLVHDPNPRAAKVTLTSF
ncbi:sugar hydrolase [Lentzea tibetensis]|uniref:Sugar hydrolase n=2 Tax=Lentzea tibetensis TaxID=2591470 RepID=A0A563EJA2_9PSEU|nr:sugar hydrolase [Lentzea tibetensis]